MSPFAPVLDEVGLPAVFREQFLLPGDAGHRVLLQGRMDCVWHRPRWLRPFLTLLARWDMIFPETGVDVPAWLVIRGDGNGGHLWNRAFRFAVVRRFDALMFWNGRHVVERTGFADIAWSLRRLDSSTLEIETVGASVRLGGIRIPVPRLLAPHVRALERATADGRVWIEVVMRLPGLGPVFGYSGTFALSRIDG